MPRPLLLILLLLVPALAHAQLNVRIEMPKRSYLAGEPVPVAVKLTNLSGREVVYRGDPRQPWLDFIVTSSRGVPLTAVGRPAFGAIKIPAGEAAARSVDLARMFPLSDIGNFSVYAVVRHPGDAQGGFQSNRKTFSVTTARPSWSQVVGVPGKRGQTHELRLIQFRGERKTQLYVQVADAASDRVIRTHHLGEVLVFREPEVMLDSGLNMHVLYLITPAIWGHVRVAPDGKFIGRDLFKSSRYGDPDLVKTSEGKVLARGGIPYDPKQEAEQREKARKATDRPAFIYE